MEGLLRHFLNDSIGIRAIVRAVKNVFNYGLDERLRKLCEALNAYREKIIFKREIITTQRNQRYKARAQPKQQQRSKRDQQISYEQLQHQSTGDQQLLYDQQEYLSSGAQKYKSPVI